MVPEDALEHGAQVGGPFEVTAFVEIGVLEAGPVGDDAPALQRAAGQQCDRAGAVIGAVGAVDARGAAKFRDHHDDGLAPRRGRIAITGTSYGGYATLVGLTFTPEVFCCGVSIVGISNLVTLLENMPPYWAGFDEFMFASYADVRTPEGRAWLRARSPLSRVDRICRPLLIGHGANDVRCTLQESEQIVTAMRERQLPVTYVVYPDEGHGFARPESRMSFNAISEAFLARHLGGRCEPFGDDLAQSSLQVREGIGEIAGLRECFVATNEVNAA